jgi:hypothetical protein
MQEASEHNTKDDCWVVIDGKVRFYLGLSPYVPFIFLFYVFNFFICGFYSLLFIVDG